MIAYAFPGHPLPPAHEFTTLRECPKCAELWSATWPEPEVADRLPAQVCPECRAKEAK